MFVTADQLLAHVIGDFVLQSDWMAETKTKNTTQGLLATAVHVLCYGFPWLFMTRSLPALGIIIGTHFVIDHWRLARYVGWLKNFLAPIGSNPPWEVCKGTGYPSHRPPFITVWLMIIVDQVMHVACNAFALKYFG